MAAEGAAVVGHGDGDAVATAREAVELFAPPDGIEVFHHLERGRERERQEEEKKSCGFRGCLLSCPKRENLGRQPMNLKSESNSAILPREHKAIHPEGMTLMLQARGWLAWLAGVDHNTFWNEILENIYRSSLNSTRIAGRFSRGSEG